MPSNEVGKMDFIEGSMNSKQHIDTLWDNLCNSDLKLGISNSY